MAPGTRFYRIADLSTIWVYVTIYEYQLPRVEVGQPVRLELPYRPGEVFRGKVIYVYPYVDPKTRQIRVRLEFPNPELMLKPEMYADVEIEEPAGESSLLVPRDAVIDVGRRERIEGVERRVGYAYVRVGPGRFEPRLVAIGEEVEGGRLQVLSGLTEGEEVVVSGQFQLDSERKVKEANLRMFRGGKTDSKPRPAPSTPKSANPTGDRGDAEGSRSHVHTDHTGETHETADTERQAGPMIGKIIEFSVKNKFLMLLLTGVLVLGGLYAVYTIRLDAIPDLSDVQVIIFTEFPGQAPQVVEDQVTYPLTTTMLAVPYAKVVRGYSFFGFSFVYIIFEDGTDIYWARSRVLEYLSFVANRLPAGVTPRLGPDATGVGWVYEYSLYSGWYCPDHQAGLYHDPKTPDHWYASPRKAPEAVRERLIRVRAFEKPGKCPVDGSTLVRAEQDLADLRSIQDWYLRYELTAVEGVSEVASLGGYVKQYQVEVDPNRLLAFNLSVPDIRRAIQRSNSDVGGRVIEMSESEYMVRGLGYLGGGTSDPGTSQRAIDDLGNVALGTTKDGAPIFLRDVAQIHLGPEIRRGLAESNGEGEVAGGIVIMRFGENADRVIENVKARLEELKAGLPPGVDIEPEYDRSALIERAVDTLKRKLLEEMTVVALIIVIFLLHFRSALVAIFVLPDRACWPASS